MSSFRRLLPPLLLALVGSMVAPPAATPQVDLAQGRQLYAGSCSRCHGISGGGGEGPSLARPTLPRAPDDATLMQIIRAGIPGTSMPGSRWFSDGDRFQVAAYVRSLGRTEVVPVPGDADRGRRLFEGAGGCLECHVVEARGTNIGPNLTAVGLRRGLDYLRESMVDPGAALPRGLTVIGGGFADFLPVRVVTKAGDEVRGMRLNEDSYTIQLRDSEGDIHSFYKLDLREIDKQFGQSFMPTYRGMLTDADLDDVVSYLAGLRGEP